MFPSHNCTSAYYVLYSNVSRREEEREGVGEREGKWSYNWKMTEESNQHSIYSLSLRWGTYHVPSTIARIQLGIYSLGQWSHEVLISTQSN